MVPSLLGDEPGAQPSAMKNRWIRAGLISVLPRSWKPACYRAMLGYQVGHRVRIGVSLIAVDHCTIADDVQIGHGNVFTRVRRLSLGDHVRIGHLNIFRGGDEVVLDSYSEFLRLNEINSIPDPLVVNPTTPRLHVGPGTIVTAGHKIDFTDEVRLGRRVILGGRNSSIWTHNRQRTAPVSIGDLAYLGSEIRMAPGSSLPERCILGIGSVVTGAIDAPGHLIAGVPARAVQPLSSEEMVLVQRKTRPDLPDDL
jgi:acetyltransferase-like isoleucine patch superfamily enzyme